MNPEEFLDAVLALPRLAAEAAAPDLTRIAWSWAGLGPVADVWIGGVDRKKRLP